MNRQLSLFLYPFCLRQGCFIVEGTIVAGLKSVQNLLKEHEVQLVNYLNGLKQEMGLLINFDSSGVEIKIKYRQLK